jgi:hypothetical protein
MFARTVPATALLALTFLVPACLGAEVEDFEDELDSFAEDGDTGDADDEAGDDQDDELRDVRPGDADPTKPKRPIPGTPSEPDACQPEIARLIAAQDIGVGLVTASNDDDSVDVRVQTFGSYALTEVHVFVGQGPLPNNGGAIAPGLFPFTEELIAPAAEWQLEVPLDELDATCGEDLTIAVHAVVVAIEDGMEVFGETAWGYGENEFEDSWGWSSSYPLCCESAAG